MNIHPLFVHFPIALLVSYSLLEVTAPFSARLRRQAWVAPVKAFLLYMGVLAAFAALVTGGMAEDVVRGVNPRAFIIEAHEPFAWATTLIYIVLAAASLVRLFDREGWGDRIVGSNRLFARIWSVKKQVARFVLDTRLLPLLALLGLIAITITGGLGAAIVYGPDVDPIVRVIYHLFWAQ